MGEPITLSGMILALGLACRASLDEYQNYGPDFSYSVKRAKMIVTQKYERLLVGNHAAGPIFALKNLGWSDRQSIDHSSSDGSMSPPKEIKIVFEDGDTDSESV